MFFFYFLLVEITMKDTKNMIKKQKQRSIKLWLQQKCKMYKVAEKTSLENRLQIWNAPVNYFMALYSEGWRGFRARSFMEMGRNESNAECSKLLKTKMSFFSFCVFCVYEV